MENRDFLSSRHHPSLPDPSRPTVLYRNEGHAVYWIGIVEETAFRCNTYLIRDGDRAFLVDPGGHAAFARVAERVAQILPPERVSGLILCHQDPDVAGSMTDWLNLNPAMEIFSTPRTHVLLPHYGQQHYPARDVEKEPELRLPGGSRLIFRPAPFLHFPGAFVTYDEASGALFSGDIWAALDIDWQLIVDDFDRHREKMDLFHKDYMASNIAARGFVRTLEDLDIRAILPQHGSIIGEKNVRAALEYLQNLVCGLDLIYADTLLDPQIPHPLSKPPEKSGSVRTPLDFSFGTTEVQAPFTDAELGHQTFALRESLSQAARLAALRDKALADLRAAECRLQQSEAKLAEAQHIAHMGHWEWDIPGNRLSWSEEIYRIFGLSPQKPEMTYQIFLAMVHPDDRECLEEAVKKALEENYPYNIDHRIILPDGEIRVVNEQARITRNAQGIPIRMLGTVQNITERKKTEEALLASHKLIETIDRLQSRFIEYTDPFSMYSGLLDDILNLTRSRYGFIAETRTDPDNTPYLKVYVQSDLSWDEVSREPYEKYRYEGFEVRQLDNLFGRVVTSGETVLSNDPEDDPRSSGFPDGHLSIDAFLGLPVYSGKQLVGEIGLANRSGGYDEAMLKYIEPVVSVLGQIIVARREREARHAAEEKLRALVSLDGLTGIPNRRRFDEYLSQEWRRALRSNMPLSMIMIDIDHFKLYNDHYGHQAGDSCLKTVASLVEKTLHRPADTVARYGGEEFACILPDTSLRGAILVAQAIRNAIAEAAIEHLFSPVAPHLTISMGISTLHPTLESDSGDLIALADQRLYRAKSLGRNRYIPEEADGS